MIKIGCSGFPMKKSLYWKEFCCVEIQQTFYNVPSLSLAEKWRKTAPPDFVWTVKAPQYITHKASSPTYRRAKKEYGKRENYGFFQPTPEVERAYEDVLRFSLKLKAKYLLFQTPPSFGPTQKNIANLIEFFKKRRERINFVLELRGNWEKEVLREISSYVKLIYVVDPFKDEPLSKNFIYFRLHGKTGYRYKYTKEDLLFLKQMVQGKNGFVFFNNIYMKENALTFKEMYA